MKLKVFLFCFMVSLFSLRGQNSIKSKIEGPGVVFGKVIDKRTNQPLSFVNIVIKDSDKVIFGEVTNEKGNFVLRNLPLNNYTVSIQYIGYKTVIKTISLTENAKLIDMKTIIIEEDATRLGEVEVIQEKSIIEQKTDRKVINIGKDLLSAGATAAEILNNIPSVSIDQQTNEVSLRGNSNVRILIDGKPSTISASQLLQQIPSSSIKQIELITNPSAKYNPEGMSGMINIVLNKNSKIGFNGSLNGGLTFGKTPKFNGSTDMNYRSGKVNFFGNYGFNNGKQSNFGFIRVSQPGEENLQDLNFATLSTSHLLKAGLDFYLNDSNTISFYTIQNISSNDGSSTVFVDFFGVPNKSDIRQLYDSKRDNKNHTYNVAYKKKFKKEGHTLDLEANYSDGDNTENSFYSIPQINFITNKSENSLVNLDYSNPLSKTSKLELGLESRIENTKNNFDLDNFYNSNFTYDRKIYSAYATFSKQIAKWNLQAGARVEDYNANALFRKVSVSDANFNDKRFTIYPSAYASYAPNDKDSYNFSVSKRVDRPSIGQINPIREFSTPQLDSEGNPKLSPQFTNSFEINYTRKTKIGSITSGVFYRHITDEIARTIFENPISPEKMILSYDNLDDNNAYGFEVSGNLDFSKWLSTNISFDAYNKTVKGYSENIYLKVNATSFNTRMNATFKASKSLRFQLSAMYRGADLSIQGKRKPMYKIDTGASWTVLKGNGTFTARVSDIFNTMHFAFERTEPKSSNGEFHWESRTAYLGFNYRFGSGNNKAMQRKARANNEIQPTGGF